VPGVVIPNRPAYRSNPEEKKELQRQVEDLMSKGYVRERVMNGKLLLRLSMGFMNGWLCHLALLMHPVLS
jgi:hypothetical protein